jgi:hypothetical protein
MSKPKSRKKTSSRKPKKRVHGYWRLNWKTGETSYVKQYLRKQPKKAKKRKRAINAEIVQNPETPKLREPPQIRGFRYVYTEHAEEPIERVAYTIRMVALVDFNYQYNMQFHPQATLYEDEPTGRTSRHLQYYHTSFFTTPEGAYRDFREKVPVMRAYGEIQFLDIQLVRVSGAGPMKEKHFKVLAEYDEPEHVPGFNQR